MCTPSNPKMTRINQYQTCMQSAAARLVSCIRCQKFKVQVRASQGQNPGLDLEYGGRVCIELGVGSKLTGQGRLWCWQEASAVPCDTTVSLGSVGCMCDDTWLPSWCCSWDLAVPSSPKAAPIVAATAAHNNLGDVCPVQALPHLQQQCRCPWRQRPSRHPRQLSRRSSCRCGRPGQFCELSSGC